MMSLCNPLAYSLIRDYFPPNKRSTANSIYSSGIYCGNAIASLNIIIIKNFGWRHGYIFTSYLGIALSVISAFILVEPPRERFTVIELPSYSESNSSKASKKKAKKNLRILSMIKEESSEESGF